MTKRFVLKVFPWIAGALFSLLFVLNVVRITARTLWGASYIWMPDFSRLLFVWIVFIGATAVYAAKDHLVMDFVVTKFPAAFRRALDFSLKILMLVFLSVLVHQGFIVSRTRMRIPYDMWDVPTGYAYMALPAMAAVMLLLTVEDLLTERNVA